MKPEFAYLPDTKKTDKEVVGETVGEHLRDDEHVGCERALQHDRHVGRVEELDGVAAALAAEAVALDGDLDAEALEVDDDGEDSDSRNEVHNVGEPLAPERLAEGTALVIPSEEEVEQRDNSTLKLGATAGVDGRRRERLPNNRLADVRRDEQGDARAKTVALLE